MDIRVKQFRAGVAALGGARRGLRYPDKLKRLAVSYWQDGRQEDASRHGVAAELGIAEATLERWAAVPGESDESSEIQEVVLTEPMVTPGPGFSILTPDGFRIEGVRVGDLPTLLRLLR